MGRATQTGKTVKVFIWNDTNKNWEPWDGVLNTGDIEIGAVEIKDATGSTRAGVGSNGLEVEIKESVLRATGSTEYVVSLASADTEYSQALPSNTKAIEFQCRTSDEIRFAYETGKVATPTDPYITLKAGMTYYKESLDLDGKTIYFASSSAGTEVELIAWT